ncbi:vWA domain-containing protein [Schinkia sp. CFF1]
MKKRYLLSFLIILSVLGMILSGCNKSNGTSSEEKNKGGIGAVNKTEKDSKPQSEIVPLPSTYENLAARPAGEFSDLKYLEIGSEIDIKKLLEMFKELPDISKQPTDQELDYFYQILLSKVQRDYKGPEELIRQMRFQSIGDPQIEDSRYQFKENLNVEIILDASGSMAGLVNGKVKMDAAKSSIMGFVKQLPKEARVGIRVYGHKGSNASSDKAISCSSSEIVYPISAYDETSFQSALNTIKPTGYTPTGLALKEAQKDLSQFDGGTNTNIVYLVSDGIATCNDNPIQAAKDLYSSNITPIINVIGFDIDSKGQNQLQEIANATEGIYTNVANESELTTELSKLSQVTEMWRKWKEKGAQSLELKRLDNRSDIFSYTTTEYVKCTDEEWVIGGIYRLLRENGFIDNSSSMYLNKKNIDYHNWIRSEIGKFDDELKALNEKSYVEALHSLEDKYKQNTNK